MRGGGDAEIVKRFGGNMKCPYLRRTEQVEQHTYDRNESESVTFEECKVVYFEAHTECIGDECAAWCDGKCHYNRN